MLNAELFSRTCLCLNLRRAARRVGRRYDDALRSVGLTSGQFAILAALLRDRPVPLGRLADDLGMDRTTLNKDLKPLQGRGLVSSHSGADDARIRALALTARGRTLLDKAMPLWDAVQTATLASLPARDWPAFRRQLDLFP